MSLGDEHEPSGGYGGTGQTRTRLPDTGTDSYGTARRPRSSSRGLVTVVGVVVLLIAAIAFANRGGDDSPGSNTDKPEAAATAPSGQRPVKSKSAAGIPSGFAHDQEGAESAAANYAVALVSADILKPARRPEIVRQVFDAGRVPALEKNLDQVYDKAFLDKVGLDQNGDAPKGSTYVSRTMPVGTKATEYSSRAATVEVWCTGVYGMTGQTSQNPVTSDWFTMTLRLRWSGGDWKVDSFAQKEGPAPVNGDNRVSPSDDISKAVEEFGGFTYAR
ncbi:hypothetical protein ABZ499_13215 [Streptomyces sp. NPDC019990]|uniref:hypothetical protein n=1 Tax=Streptomyces sp. NPDC019990 TaxID=3154693 RepID=UPI0033D7E84C